MPLAALRKLRFCYIIRFTQNTFHNALGLTNRLRARTRATMLKVQNELDVKTRFRFRTRVTTVMIKYFLETMIALMYPARHARACSQHDIVIMHTYNEILTFSCSQHGFVMVGAVLHVPPNRDPVLRDRKVLPEIPNRPFLHRVFFQASNIRIYESVRVRNESV